MTMSVALPRHLRRATVSLLFLAACRGGPPREAPSEAPYAGHQDRPIKALAPEEVAGLLGGEGMGYALAAELNHYPGPRHVLDLADSLGLSGIQRDSVEAIRRRMSERAVALGRRIVAAEAALDSLFARGAIDPVTLEERTAEIARMQGALRAAHLRAHLETHAVLDKGQIARYGALRGYGPAESGQDGEGHEHR